MTKVANEDALYKVFQALQSDRKHKYICYDGSKVFEADEQPSYNTGCMKVCGTQIGVFHNLVVRYIMDCIDRKARHFEWGIHMGNFLFFPRKDVYQNRGVWIRENMEVVEITMTVDPEDLIISSKEGELLTIPFRTE
jgi:hypothetical protein